MRVEVTFKSGEVAFTMTPETQAEGRILGVFGDSNTWRAVVESERDYGYNHTTYKYVSLIAKKWQNPIPPDEPQFHEGLEP